MGQKDTKKKIFYAAAELFAQNCYADVSIRDIAKKVGIKPASIYNHYTSKEEILKDILDFYDRELDHIQEIIDKESISTKSPEERFKNTIYYFDPEDLELMGWLMRIVFNEQFRSQKAAEIIFDKSMKQRVESYKAFLMSISPDNQISEWDCQCYAELIARVQLSYSMEFTNRLVDHEENTRPTMEELMTFVNNIALEHQRRGYSEKDQ